MYRRTLAASWACRAGELPPQELIENLFAGGTGWRTDIVQKSAAEFRAEQAAKDKAHSEAGDDSGSISDTSSKLTVQHARQSSIGLRPKTPKGPHSRHSSIVSIGGSDAPSLMSGMSGRKGISRQVKESEKEKRRRGSAFRQVEEITEFDVRNDLKTWQISAKG
jgi:hypothetical protein